MEKMEDRKVTVRRFWRSGFAVSLFFTGTKELPLFSAIC